MLRNALLLGLTALLLAACSAIPLASQTPTPPPTASPTPSPAPTLGSTPTPPGPATLEVWLPPQFAPSENTSVGKALQQRLDAFTTSRPDVRIQVRIKTLDGPGGMLDSLTTASAAAPLSLPDLVALPRPLLETAALKGLLYPFEDLIADPQDADWFDYAMRLARLQDSLFGLPFCGDALLMVYRPEVVPQPPATLAELSQLTGVLAFPAADPQALYTLALYQAAGGDVLDDEGRPVLQAEPLTRVLAAYHDAAQGERLPFWLTQLQSDDQAWDAFQKMQADMVITWTSRLLLDPPQSVSMAPLPTVTDNDFTLATGWVWALANPHSERQEVAAQLAEFLSDAGFLGEWSLAAGCLPPRPTALDAWQDSQLRLFVRQASLAARLIPSADVLSGLASPLVEATAEMLKLENDPSSAAQQAVSSLLTP